jgi:hypothetical protein
MTSLAKLVMFDEFLQRKLLQGHRRHRRPIASLHDNNQEQRMFKEQPTEPLADGLADAARRLGISRGLIYKLHKAGKVRLVKLAGRTLITRAEQARLLAEKTGDRIADGGAAR